MNVFNVITTTLMEHSLETVIYSLGEERQDKKIFIPEMNLLTKQNMSTKHRNLPESSCTAADFKIILFSFGQIHRLIVQKHTTLKNFHFQEK